MGLISWVNKKIPKLNVWDIGCIKWASILFGIIIGAYIADFTKRYIWILIILAVILAIKPIVKFFKK